MGSTYCVKYCDKTEKEQKNVTEEKKEINEQYSSIVDSAPQYNYNNFAKKFIRSLQLLKKCNLPYKIYQFFLFFIGVFFNITTNKPYILEFTQKSFRNNNIIFFKCIEHIIPFEKHVNLCFILYCDYL